MANKSKTLQSGFFSRLDAQRWLRKTKGQIFVLDLNSIHIIMLQALKQNSSSSFTYKLGSILIS